MLNSILKYTIIYLLFISQLLIAEEKPIDPIKWSAYQGKKTWQEAKEHCQNLKMRLPTINDLILANESGTTVGWRKYGTRYWSVNKNLGYNSLSYKALNTLVSDKIEEIHRAESQLGVFCANVTEESAELDVIRELVENKANESEIQRAREDLFAKKFSEYQGKLNWDDANKKCKSLKLRLPTVTELIEAHESGITASWQKDGINYWSSTPYDAESYYRLSILGGTSYGSRNYYYDVRCRR